MATLLANKMPMAIMPKRTGIDRGSGVRVRIFDPDSGKRQLRLRFPLGLVRLILLATPLSYIKKFPHFISKADILRLLAIVGREGLLVDVFDDEKFVQVRIGRISQNHFLEGNKMSEERKQVLKMLEEGKINAEEAEKLLAEISAGTDIKTRPVGAKMIRIRVYEGNLEKPKVRVSIPISLAKFAMHFVPKDHKATINEMNIDLDEIIRQIEEGAEGHLVDVEDVDEDSGKPVKVEIWVE